MSSTTASGAKRVRERALAFWSDRADDSSSGAQPVNADKKAKRRSERADIRLSRRQARTASLRIQCSRVRKSTHERLVASMLSPSRGVNWWNMAKIQHLRAL